MFASTSTIAGNPRRSLRCVHPAHLLAAQSCYAVVQGVDNALVGRVALALLLEIVPV